MLEGLRHEGYHLLFNHLNVHKNLDNYMSNLAADCEINQHLEKPHKHWISREYIAQLCSMPEHTVKEKAGSLYYYELLNQKMPPNKRKQPKKGNQESDRENGKQKQSPGMCSAKHWHEAEVGKNGNYIPVDVTIKTVFENAATQAKGRGSLSAHIEGAIENLNKPPQIKWQNAVKKRWVDTSQVNAHHQIASTVVIQWLYTVKACSPIKSCQLYLLMTYQVLFQKQKQKSS